MLLHAAILISHLGSPKNLANNTRTLYLTLSKIQHISCLSLFIHLLSCC